jgi:predicted KAP-like P-loop ATPase
MYSSDQAIENIEEDLLGRAAFATYLSKTICEYSGSESLVIGLFGKWGTGKTSVINMAIKQVEKASNETTNKPMIVKFSPWNYSDKDNLISLFFKCLKGKLSKDENRELKEKIGKALNDYAGAFDALAAIPLVGDALATVLKTLVQVKGN